MSSIIKVAIHSSNQDRADLESQLGLDPKVMEHKGFGRVSALFADSVLSEEFSDHPTAHDVLEVVPLLHATEGAAVHELPSSASTWPAVIKQSHYRNMDRWR